MGNRVARDTRKLNKFYHLLFILFFLSVAVSFLKPASAYADFTASLNEVDSSALGTKTPLILVHGLHGREKGIAYWQNIVNYFNSQNTLKSQYKLYKLSTIVM